MANDKKRPRTNLVVYIAAVLFCLTLLSVHLTSGLYAKYVTTASGGDSARVIKFGNITITESGDFNESGKLMIIPGVDITKKAVVEFEGSESATYVFVEFVLSANWTKDGNSFEIVNGSEVFMEWAVADGWKYLKSEGDSHIYYRELAPNTKLDKVDVIADGGKITVSDEITKADMPGFTGTFIKIQASVVQSGGFENATDAWTSLEAKEG